MSRLSVAIHFLIRIFLRKIARKRNCSDGTIRKEMQTALGFIEGLVCILSDK
ncbi:hypothetical protein RNP97_001107 [Enterobacter bugandensis]|nr:hypothetical protein [Enterobacter bugandensis]NIB53628.1 hypothetical protein [Enterobacter sp. 725m/11]ELQ3993514.1 hypothetical protein [Enterobacter bugandensis]ELV3037723.1 hypothetical protein [Enterobacter bugandensis]ELX8411658.1 hypothetical protein [Enterobacter bugandensis]